MKNIIGSLLLLMVVSIGYAREHAHGADQYAPAIDTTIPAGHLRIHYTVSGHGPALLLLHAGYQDLHMWDTQATFFQRNYQVVRMDMPGHGLTTGVDTNLLVADVIRIVLDSLHIGKVCIAGVSMGAACATDFVLAYPERVSRLILVSPGLSGWPAVMKMDSASGAIFTRMDSIRATGDHQLMARHFTEIWCDGPFRRPEEVDKRVRDYIYTTTEHNQMNDTAFPVFNRRRAATRLKEIKCPVLIIQGDKDVPFTLRVMQWYRHELPAAAFVHFPGVAHMVNMEKAKEFDRVVYRWLKEAGSSETMPPSHSQ